MLPERFACRLQRRSAVFVGAAFFCDLCCNFVFPGCCIARVIQQSFSPCVPRLYDLYNYGWDAKALGLVRKQCCISFNFWKQCWDYGSKCLPFQGCTLAAVCWCKQGDVALFTSCDSSLHMGAGFSGTGPNLFKLLWALFRLLVKPAMPGHRNAVSYRSKAMQGKERQGSNWQKLHYLVLKES